MASGEEDIHYLSTPTRDVDESTRREYHNVGAIASLYTSEYLRRLLILDSVFRYDYARLGQITQQTAEERSSSSFSSNGTLWSLPSGINTEHREVVYKSAKQLYHPSSVEFIRDVSTHDLSQYLACLEHFYYYEHVASKS